MKAKLYSDGEFIGTCDDIAGDTYVIIYAGRFFCWNSEKSHFEECGAQTVTAIEYAPRVSGHTDT